MHSPQLIACLGSTSCYYDLQAAQKSKELEML